MAALMPGPDRLRERAALRRVGELVTGDADELDVLEAVVAEAHALFAVDFTALLRYEPDGSAYVVAVDDGPTGLEVGDRVPWMPGGLALKVFRSGRPARIDSHADLPAAQAEAVEEIGVVAGVAAPISMQGRLWGVLTAMRRTGRVDDGLEHRLSHFAGLAATALSAARDRDELRALADEQSALRRVAELVARGTSEDRLLEAVALEAAGLMGDEATTLARFVGDRGFLVLATHDGPFRVGTTVRLRPEDEGVVPELLRTGRPVRVDHHDDHPLSYRTWGLPGRAVRSEVAVPIQVDDHTWGLLAVATDGQRLRADAESVLQQLAELVAAALANAQARAEVVGLADEQAALRRLAELAARDAPATDVVQAVAAEAARLVSVEFTTVVRYGRDGSTEVVALSGAPEGIELGMRGAPGGDGAIPRVWRTRRPARIDDLGPMTGSWATRMRGLGYSTTAGAPILIRGELWGALVVVARAELSPHIEDTLARFTDLAGTAISHAQARHDLRVLAHEQAAMRRVAELVARGATLDEVFSAVETEASRLVGSPTVLHRTDHVAAGAGDPWSTTTVAGRLRGLTGPAGVGHTGATEPSGLTVPVNVEGRRWGTIGTATPESELPTGTRQRLEQLGDLAAAAIANAENRARLTASRARVVATADETRRRLQRDVHDGAQQRLVQTIITLKLALDGVPREDPVHAQLAEALYHAERANADLRDVVHGILPAALTQGGLRTGVQSLIADLGFPVGLDFDAPRLPAEAETTAYFVVAEALTNVVKHAGARRASVEVALRDDGLAIEVVDDGVGGAEPARGSGLTGLSDRVAAADGSLTLVSPPGGGTVVRVLLPVDGGGADPDVGLLRRYGSE